MPPPDAATASAHAAAPHRPGPSPAPVGVEEAEAALVEHYPRLVRIASLVLPPALGRNRRVLTAHSVVQRSLPRARTAATRDDAYAVVRGQALRQALDAGRPERRRVWPRRGRLPSPLPRVWGLRLFPRSGGADELAPDRRLSALSSPARAAFVLRGPERLPDPEVRRLLTAAGVADPRAALAEADGIGTEGAALLESPEYDACSLQVRPTDLLRRLPPSAAAAQPGAGAARAENSPACGAREPRVLAGVLAGVLWKSRDGGWYVLAAGSDAFRSVRATGGVTGEARGRVLAVRAKPGERAELDGAPADGTRAGAPR